MNSLKLKHFEHQTDITFPEFDVEEGNIRLYVTPHGKFPSVTSILSLYNVDDDSNWLQNWYDRVGEDVAKKITQNSIDRGNSLHNMADKYLNNRYNSRNEIVGPGRTLFNRLKPYWDQIQLVIATEACVYNVSDCYAGRVDGVVLLHDKLYVIDHKNSRRSMKSSFIGAKQKEFKYKVQIAAYALAIEDMKDIIINDGCLFVGNHLSSNVDVIRFELDQFKEEVKLITHAYQTQDIDLLHTNSNYYKLK